MRAYIPPMKPVPKGATQADRERMFEEYKAELCRMNPHMHNPDGSLKDWRAQAWIYGIFSIGLIVFVVYAANEVLP